MDRAAKRRQQKLAKKAAAKAKRAGSASLSPVQPTPAIQESLNLAVQHHTQGRLPEAESLYQEILRIDANQPVALHLLGVLAHQVGNNEIAVDLIGKALAVSPDFAEAHSSLGNAFLALGRPDEAVASYLSALKTNPNYAEAHTNLGLALMDLGKREEAEASYLKALAIKPEFAQAHFNLGNVLLDLGRTDEAVASYQKALAIKPDYAETHSNLGAAFKELGMMDNARASYQDALTIKPDFAEAENNLGGAFHDMGKLEDAETCYRGALDKKPEYAEAHYNLHALVLDPDDMMPSIQCMKKAIEYNPDNRDYRFILGLLLDYSGDPQAAAEHFDQVEKGGNSDRAKLDAWRYIQSADNKLPVLTGSNIQAFKLALDGAAKDGLVMEFGVRFGTSIRQIACLVDQDVHGFDSFEGLPEAWHHEPKGTYSTKGVLPSVQENVFLYSGWFEETLPDFIDKHQDPVRFINIDCDIYSSTKTVLDLLSGQFGQGTVIVFDEFIGNENWREDEFKAFQEAVQTYGWAYEYLGFSFMTKQVVVRIN